ncbi:carbohydrate ABC transporter substrate-binding protein (CUT1 family) [Klugiella xanthotipulae]|uniref:Carbohydrate ABC transporter substrate-binding protein (CUT1 family) n=1 Tax=Klugiella xanthotipulae TaxID=244735 RepID=A0A543HZA1_9MICO|nr:ABC transporter substrate-binding protein [Klugiella xanthotipulae]TQM63651.1 carbohydrate ABC transporter substrate-binding protein (CUT1 family) [Klugiella xanthotipulae]
MSTTFKKRVWLTPLALVSVAGLLLTGCSNSSNDAGGGGSKTDCTDYEQYGTFEGDEVEVYATIVEVEADQLEESWADFEECTGITVNYVGDQGFETQINVRVEGGDAPDLAVFPQPGLLQRIVETGKVVPAPKSVEDNVDEGWSESWKTYGTVDGTFYASPLMASVKGWVWYSPSDFTDRGVEVPTTLAELNDLTKTLAAEKTDTYRPWCVGFGSDAATGWPGTDWIEDYVLRQSGPDVYDQWVAGDVKFNSPEIKKAFDSVGDIILNPDNVNGGFGDVSTINTTTFQEAGQPILDGNCSLHHQASFYEAQWPEGTTVAKDGDVWAFLLPSEEADAGKSVTGGGEFVAAFNDNKATAALQTYMSSALWANNRVSLGGVISANKGLDPDNAQSEIGKEAVRILQDPDTVFRFDASDLMPAAVGSASFWKGMVNWVNGESTDSVLTSIDKTWP